MACADMVKVLQDLCVERSYSLPTYELIKTEENANEKKYTMTCTVDAISRMGVSDNKTDVRHKAAAAVYDVLVLQTKYEQQGSPISLRTALAAYEDNSKKKFEIYRTLSSKNRKPKITPINSIVNRHNFFQNYPKDLKRAAFAVLDSEDYSSDVAQVAALLKALNITATTEIMTNLNSATDPLIYIELNVNYRAVFAGVQKDIYRDILEYFRIML